ncbi:MAG: hypothetical protein M1818_003725 [Claussenomyces sp. TS43310]|nr:MAG: hypothetical protein M1818_003725 [Claussenomyces sp. TS43310]
MSYNDDAVLAKLSALNETQESIVTVAQWVMFHRRHADRTGQLWLQRLKDSNSNKRLNLIYLANEVAQQSKARRKDDFLIAFSPVIAEATATAYKGATNEVQSKLKRVVEVWRQRAIFELPIQDAIEARIEELDRSRSSGKKGLFDGGSIFSKSTGSVPVDLAPLVAPQQTVTKLALSTKTSVNAANQEYEKLTDPSAVTPSAPVHAARLNGLLKTLANAEGAVAESIKARKTLIEGLEKILDINRSTLAAEEVNLTEISSRKEAIDAKKREVEDSIMRGFAPISNPGTPAEASPGNINTPTTPAPEPDRPEVEALTPPPFEAVSPHSPPPEGRQAPPVEEQPIAPVPTPTVAGSDLLATLSGSYGLGQQNNGSYKKRKLDDGFPDLGGDVMDDIDDDVAAMLRNENSRT